MIKLIYMTKCVAFFCAVTCSAEAALAQSQPYAGQEAREIATLSAQDVDDLINGRGWGFAKAAELNGYPGPAHILELADHLDLTDAQRDAVQGIFDRMNAQARELGAAYVQAERDLNLAFKDHHADPDRIAALTNEAGRLRSELRLVHLAAHLDAAPVLTLHQTHLYTRARGYNHDAAQTGHNHN